jgi:hypothetical protein
MKLLRILKGQTYITKDFGFFKFSFILFFHLKILLMTKILNLFNQYDLDSQIGCLQICKKILNAAEQWSEEEKIDVLIELEEMKEHYEHNKNFYRIYKTCRSTFLSII